MTASPRKRVTFLVHDLGANYIGPVVRMARYLQPEFEVGIAGPCLWGKANAMYAKEFPFTVVDVPRVYRFPEFFSGVRKLADAATGDIVIAMKAFAPALPAALLAKKRRGAKVAVYLDEWDGATPASWTPRERLTRLAHDWHHPCDDLWTPFWERRLRHADLVLGTTRFLEKKFGAVRYDLGADTDFFKPQPEEETQALRRELGLEDEHVLVFGGVARAHKGLETFAEGAAAAGWTLLLAGPGNECTAALAARRDLSVRCTGALPHPAMPRYLGLADALAVPLGTGPMAASQMPCKVYEAMAMARPVLASAVSDVPEVLAGCGWTVPSGDPAAVAAALREIADNPAEASRRAAAARERAISRYDAASAAARLRAIIRGLLSPGKDSP
jgi:glycosyltransferase involved in cell wall biosynthesis